MRPALLLPALVLTAACSTTSTPSGSVRYLTGEPFEEEGTAREESEHAEEFKQHAVNLFVGGATNEHDESGFSAGLDFERKFNPQWGVAGFVEGSSGDLRSFVGGIVASFHPVEPLALVAGPGVEREQGDEFGDPEWSAIFRLGALYEFPLGNDLLIAPTIYYDISGNANTFVFGVTLGYLF